MYLLLKSEQAMNEDTDLMDGDAVSAIESHPVIARLQQLNKLSQKLEERVESKVDTLNEQIDTLVKANDLINTGEDDSESLKQDDDESAAADDDKEQHSEGESVAENAEAQVSKYSASSSSEDENEEDIATSVMNDAKFGLRPQELGAPRQKAMKRSRRAVPLDYGDEDDSGLNTKATQSLASTINAIEQRSATRSRKRRSAATTETLDEQDEDNDALRRGLEMMEAELGRLDSDEEEHDNAELDEELNGDPDEDDFYKSVNERSKAKKQRKAAMYTVAPKYPGMDHEIQGELCYFLHMGFQKDVAVISFSVFDVLFTGERAISKTIMKNRGLVAHKSKLNRNPRVKKREQYRKALVRRKGHVRDVRTEEGHQYGGEETGIKSGLSRSRKLGTR
jgi:U3 small nucleolar RNA-associated protein 3